MIMIRDRRILHARRFEKHCARVESLLALGRHRIAHRLQENSSRRRLRDLVEAIAAWREAETTLVQASRALRTLKAAATHRGHHDERAARLYAAYQAGASMCSLARQENCHHKNIHDMFVRRGWPLRPPPPGPHRGRDGTFVRNAPLTPAEIAAAVEAAPKLAIPPGIRHTWRKLTLEQRAAIVARLRERFPGVNPRPTGPCSANVRPFAYGTPEAHAIADRLNAGRNSKNAVVKIDLCSQGLIWDGRLWFWATSKRVGYQSGPWRPGAGRPLLHHAIWTHAHGRPVPRGGVVRFADGNANNHDPANLVLDNRDNLLRENQATGLTAKSRDLTAHLLSRHQGEAAPSFDVSTLKPKTP